MGLTPQFGFFFLAITTVCVSVESCLVSDVGLPTEKESSNQFLQEEHL